MARTLRFREEDIATALRAGAGMHTAAAKILENKYGSCAPNTVKNYIERSDYLKGIAEDITNTHLDLAESKLILAIKNGDMKAVFFFLRTKGKKRGYSERIENTGPNGGPIQYEDIDNFDLSDLSTDELKALRKLQAKAKQNSSADVDDSKLTD